MTVVGCPLSFQMTAAQPDLKPVVRSVPYSNSVIVYVFQIGELYETDMIYLAKQAKLDVEKSFALR